MDLGKKVLEASQRILGSKHPNTLRSMNNLVEANKMCEGCSIDAPCRCCATATRVV